MFPAPKPDKIATYYYIFKYMYMYIQDDLFLSVKIYIYYT